MTEIKKTKEDLALKAIMNYKREKLIGYALVSISQKKILRKSMM